MGKATKNKKKASKTSANPLPNILSLEEDMNNLSTEDINVIQKVHLLKNFNMII